MQLSVCADGVEEMSFDLDSPLHKSHPTRTLFYPSLDKCLSLEADLQVILICLVSNKNCW